MIGPRVLGARVLDLFAGSGALGLEALSRGGERAVLVDRDPVAVRFMGINAAACGVEKRVRILRADVAAAMRRLEEEGETFHLVFMDPPYGTDEVAGTLVRLGGLVLAGGMVAAEHGCRDAVPGEAEGWDRIRFRRYGDTAVSIFVPSAGDGRHRKNDPDSDPGSGSV